MDINRWVNFDKINVLMTVIFPPQLLTPTLAPPTWKPACPDHFQSCFITSSLAFITSSLVLS